ncbi:MAG: GTPase, partial [Candidatus Krumholzibacteriia bacterium]
MPANLTPQYLEAERRFKEAGTAAEKLKALRHMMAVIPKHKGTEKLRADLRRRLSRIHEEIETERRRKSGGRPSPGHVPREGAGQVVLLGAPNCGKSSLVAALTNARPKIAAYPFTTHEPQSGMMGFEDVHVQLVDTPAVSAEFMEPWLSELVRNADRALLVADLGNDALLEDLETLFRRLGERRVSLVPLGGVTEGGESDCIETLVAANQSDRPGAAERLELLREMLAELLGAALPGAVLHVVSATAGEGLGELRKALFDALRVVRVYTKTPGHQPDFERPFTLPRGSTVMDLAQIIHK